MKYSRQEKFMPVGVANHLGHCAMADSKVYLKLGLYLMNCGSNRRRYSITSIGEMVGIFLKQTLIFFLVKFITNKESMILENRAYNLNNEPAKHIWSLISSKM